MTTFAFDVKTRCDDVPSSMMEAWRLARVENVVILFSTMCVFSVMMLLRVEMHGGGGAAAVWGDYGEQTTKQPAIRQMAMPAMKTIVAYSPEKQAEMERKYPVSCQGRWKHKKKAVVNEWQEVGGAGVSLYSAYYDDRVQGRPYLRVLAVTNGTEDLGPLYCQTWSGHQDAEAVEAAVTPIWWKEWDAGTRRAVTPLLISCPLSGQRRKSFLGSVSTKPCDQTSNLLQVETPAAGRFARNFTVCVKDMNFSQDISARLVEWFELLRLLGADKVDVYVSSVPSVVGDILRHYSDVGFVTIRRAPRPASGSLWQRRRDHLLAYNDCLYRNLRSSRYVVPLDIDEIIVPRAEETWDGLLDKLDAIERGPPGAASLAVSNAFFFDSFSEDAATNDYPDYARRKAPHVLTHLWRSSLISPVPQYSKSFVSTSRALTVFNHYALNALAGAERARAVPPDVALLHHYKATCRPALVDCHQYTVGTVKDDTLLRLADTLISNVNAVLDTI